MPATTKRKRVHSKNQSLDMSVRPAKHPKTSPFADLPTEIVHHVFTFFDTPTLMDVRLGCKSGAYDVVGPSLFESVTLIPHLYFMDRFIFTFRCSRLRIRTMFIDVRWIEQMVGLHQEYMDTKSYDVGHRAHESSCYTLDRLSHLYGNNRTEHLRALESAAIATIFSFTTSLTTLKMNCFTHPYYYEGPIPQPPALGALLGRCGLDETGTFCETEDLPVFPPPSVYLSIVGPLVVAAPQLKQLVLRHFDPRKLYQTYNDDGSFHTTMDDCVHPWSLFIQVLNRLAHLDMQLTGDSSSIEHILANATCRMLRAASKLTSLKLHIDANSSCQKFGNYETMRVERIPLLKSFREHPVPSASLPSLKTLWLRDVACTAQELQHFLILDTPRLRSLTLDNCMLLPPEEQQDHLACWIETIKRLRTKMRLTTMNFHGYMTNLGRQHWHIADDTSLNDSSPVKARMIDWFFNKSAPERACPLNVFELGGEELDVSQEDDILRNATDESWSMACPMANRVHLATASETTDLDT